VKESEVDKAVELAHWIMDSAVPVSINEEEKRLLAGALVALDEDDVCDDDDDDEETHEIGPIFGDRVLQSLFSDKTTIEEEEYPLPDNLQPSAAREEQLVEYEWPPWQNVAIVPARVCKLTVGRYSAQNYHLGMRLLAGGQKPGFFRDLWRKLAHRTWRVVDIHEGVVTVEQGR
jgi:hypothetical protein